MKFTSCSLHAAEYDHEEVANLPPKKTARRQIKRGPTQRQTFAAGNKPTPSDVGLCAASKVQALCAPIQSPQFKMSHKGCKSRHSAVAFPAGSVGNGLDAAFGDPLLYVGNCRCVIPKWDAHPQHKKGIHLVSQKVAAQDCLKPNCPEPEPCASWIHGAGGSFGFSFEAGHWQATLASCANSPT